MSHTSTFVETLRRRGYRITAQREMIIECICRVGQHVAAEDVLERVRQYTLGIDLSTVYRTLDLLVEEGLASSVDLGDGRAVYAARQHAGHVHLVCRRCGGILDVDASPFEPLLEQLQVEFGFTCCPRHFALYGLCAECRAALADPDMDHGS